MQTENKTQENTQEKPSETINHPLEQLPSHITDGKLIILKRLVGNIYQSLQKIEEILQSTKLPSGLDESPAEFRQHKTQEHLSDTHGSGVQTESMRVDLVLGLNEKEKPKEKTEEGRVVEGVFDGQNMIGQDGKEYTVPPNYASKSKLVEGDILKLNITGQGSFIYKQIGPIERKRVVAELDYDPLKNQYSACLGDKDWKLLTASATYYKGEKGDEVIILVPQTSKSTWAAVENIIKKYNVQ